MSGPFGLQQGLKLNEIPFENQEIQPYLYLFTSLQKKHSSFSQYALKITPTYGLTWIKAIGNPIQTNSFGTALQTNFSDFLERLKKIYGEPKKSDFLLSGSCWDRPEDWLSGLDSGERVLCAQWDRENGLDLPNNLKCVFLGAQAIDSQEGNIVVEYYFENDDAAEKEINALEDDAL